MRRDGDQRVLRAAHWDAARSLRLVGILENYSYVRKLAAASGDTATKGLPCAKVINAMEPFPIEGKQKIYS